MGDFYQNGLVTTLHNLRLRTLEDLEKNLLYFSRKRPIALVIPCLYSELEGTALPNIIDELTKVEYLNEVVIGLDRVEYLCSRPLEGTLYFGHSIYERSLVGHKTWCAILFRNLCCQVYVGAEECHIFSYKFFKSNSPE